VDDGYFTVMRIRFRSGGAFTAADTTSSEPVVIVNETLARQLWPGESPLGRILITSRVERRVVGVVADVRYFSLDQNTGPEMYMPIRQTGDYELVDLVVRASDAPASLVPAVRAALEAADPDLPVTQFRTMEDLVDRSLFARRFVLRLLAGFAGFGLILASLGIYAVIAYSVSQRRQEIGIRLALGASPRVVQVHFLTETLKLVLAGLAAGIPVSWMAAGAIRGFLFGVESTDPMTFGAVLLLLGGVAALAGYVPARRASRIDPITALRSQ
jgi:predicted permease